jgi:hypothetical protein
MKRTLLAFFIVALVILMGLVGGCGDANGPATVDESMYSRNQVQDLNDPYGGFNLADEAPGFDDPELLREFGDDAAFADPYENDPVVREVEFDRDGRLRGGLYLAVTWGNLHRDSSVTNQTDWTGSLFVNPGILLLKRVIRFEPEDSVLPRTEPGVVEWVSHTSTGFDGILVRVVPCPPNLSVTNVQSGIDSASTLIAFATGPLTLTFTLAELPGLHRIVTLDDGNAVSFDAVYVPPMACPLGFLHGVWRRDPDGTGGAFYGKYVSESGLHMGFVRGFYGVNKRGEKVLFGKWISRTGEFRGILRGTYGDTDENKTGYFSGHWVDRDLHVFGRVKGEWRRDDEHIGGYFRGTWMTDCFTRL